MQRQVAGSAAKPPCVLACSAPGQGQGAPACLKALSNHAGQGTRETCLWIRTQPRLQQPLPRSQQPLPRSPPHQLPRAVPWLGLGALGRCKHRNTRALALGDASGLYGLVHAQADNS